MTRFWTHKIPNEIKTLPRPPSFLRHRLAESACGRSACILSAGSARAQAPKEARQTNSSTVVIGAGGGRGDAEAESADDDDVYDDGDIGFDVDSGDAGDQRFVEP